MSLQPFYISDAHLASLPMSGPAWDRMEADASKAGDVDISDQDDNDSSYLLALALKTRRLLLAGGNLEAAKLARAKIHEIALAAIDTENGGRALAAGREGGAVGLAIDLMEIRDARLNQWFRELLRETLEGRTLISTHEARPNNWGTHAGFSRLCIDLILMRYGSAAQRLEARLDFDRAIAVWRGWFGDRDQYVGFVFNQDGWQDWQADPSKPVGINPKGATKNGHSIDGVLPDDQRRSEGGFVWPPPKQNYVWEGLQGAVASTHLIHRVRPGLKAWEWSDAAILRAFRWLHDHCDYPASGDDTWQPHMVNHFYGLKGSERFPAPIVSQHGKHVGYTCWTHPSAA